MGDRAELAIVVPTRGRPHKLGGLVEDFKAVTNAEMRFVFVVDFDDPESERAGRNLGTVVKLSNRPGYCAAVNAGIAVTTEDYVLVASDDVRPHAGWFERAKTHFSDTIGFVSPNDLGNPYVQRGLYSTHPIIARWYLDKYKPLYSTRYYHNGCDVEASRLAIEREAYVYDRHIVLEHLHPIWGKNEVDQTYLEGGMDMEQSAKDNAALAEFWPDKPW